MTNTPKQNTYVKFLRYNVGRRLHGRYGRIRHGRNDG